MGIVHLLHRALVFMEAPSALRACQQDLPHLLPYTHPIMAKRGRSVEDRQLLVEAGVSRRTVQAACNACMWMVQGRDAKPGTHARRCAYSGPA